MRALTERSLHFAEGDVQVDASFDALGVALGVLELLTDDPARVPLREGVAQCAQARLEREDAPRQTEGQIHAEHRAALESER